MIPSPPNAPARIDALLADALARRASDIHLEPTPAGYDLRYRIDGLLQTLDTVPPAEGRALVTRLMVLAQLLTYRLDIPQEGRLTLDALPAPDKPLDLRLAVIPTTHGLRAVLRLPADLLQPRSLEELNLPAAAVGGLKQFAAADAGLLIVTGPAGSGKTTTLYALLSHIAATQSGLSIISLEDPVERHLAGITQIEVSPFGQLTYEKALRSILRQDPQVLMLGEIRDAATASLAIQAALAGHRLLCTLHAAHPAGAIARLIEMGLEPYQITSALFGILTQRLLRRKNQQGGEGDYQGRLPLAEFAPLTPPLRQAILARADADTLRTLIDSQPDHQTLRQAAQRLIDQNLTDAAEVTRILGPEPPPSPTTGGPEEGRWRANDGK
jgi:type II secretory ATPase GspE/PulE/Tfp pilus assembly ATPase PilB-like protein